MARILRNLSRFFDRLRGRRGEANGTPTSLICSVEVNWISGLHKGRGEVREFCGEALRMKTDCPLLKGQVIRIEPSDSPNSQGIGLDASVGTVLYSRKRRGGVEVGVRLLNPERFADLGGLAWARLEPRCRSREVGSRRGLASSKPILRLIRSEAQVLKSSSSIEDLKEIK